MKPNRTVEHIRQPMTVQQALEWVEGAIEECREMRLRRWDREWPVGHAEREEHRPRFVERKRR